MVSRKPSQSSNRPSEERHNAAKTAARKILAAYPNYNPNKDYVLLMIATLEIFPPAVIERVSDLRSGITGKSPQFMPTQGELLRFCNECEEIWFKLQKPTARERIAARPEEPDPRPQSLEDRKAFVTRELGYDPASARPNEPCFRTWRLEPSLWHDKQELAKSRDRIAAHMASKDYLGA
jgi:hypothetical protein